MAETVRRSRAARRVIAGAATLCALVATGCSTARSVTQTAETAMALIDEERQIEDYRRALTMFNRACVREDVSFASAGAVFESFGMSEISRGFYRREEFELIGGVVEQSGGDVCFVLIENGSKAFAGRAVEALIERRYVRDYAPVSETPTGVFTAWSRVNPSPETPFMLSVTAPRIFAEFGVASGVFAGAWPSLPEIEAAFERGRTRPPEEAAPEAAALGDAALDEGPISPLDGDLTLGVPGLEAAPETTPADEAVAPSAPPAVDEPAPFVDEAVSSAPASEASEIETGDVKVEAQTVAGPPAAISDGEAPPSVIERAPVETGIAPAGE